MRPEAKVALSLPASIQLNGLKESACYNIGELQTCFVSMIVRVNFAEVDDRPT